MKGNVSYRRRSFSLLNVKESLDSNRGVILPVSLKSTVMKLQNQVEDTVNTDSLAVSYPVDSYVVPIEVNVSEGYIRVYYFQGRNWGFSGTMRIKPSSAFRFMSQADHFVEVSFDK